MNNPGIGSLRSLVNSTYDRVWMHQYSNNTGWADCFDPNVSYMLSGSRDANPGNIQLTSNSNFCPSNYLAQAYFECAYIYPLAWTQNTGLGDVCYQASGSTTWDTTGQHFIYLTNGTGYRVWLHQYANNGGWADCYTDLMAYLVYGTRDESPGNLQRSANSSAC